MFYLYCRSGSGKPWYPVSAMKGDGQSKGLINAWLNSPLAKGVFKTRLDEGMARSIFESEKRLASLACEQYSHMRGLKQRLEWGYKIVDRELMYMLPATAPSQPCSPTRPSSHAITQACA